MIPKKIHYCWFGSSEKPKLAQKCIASWKKHCPDYEIIEWNEDNFNLDYKIRVSCSRMKRFMALKTTEILQPGWDLAQKPIIPRFFQ